jgi:hypothetical protein
MARAATSLVVAALAKNLPHRSRENEFTDGRVGIFVKKYNSAYRRWAKKVFQKCISYMLK